MYFNMKTLRQNLDYILKVAPGSFILHKKKMTGMIKIKNLG